MNTRWEFGDCTVIETADGFDVHMEPGQGDEDRGTVVQHMVCDSIARMEEDRAYFDAGNSPRDCAEDGIGNTVCYANGEVVE